MRSRIGTVSDIHLKSARKLLVVQLGVWRPYNAISGLTHSEAEVNVVASIWRLFVEPANLFEDVLANHHATAAHS
jgi:hypothetical protein